MILDLDHKIRRFKNRILYVFFSGVNWRKTILFNYRMLPRHIAKRLPIVLYGNVDVSKCTGKIEIISETPIRHRQWVIGQSDCWVNGRYTAFEMTYLAIIGKLQLHGKGRIANGCRIYVRENAALSLGDGFFLNTNSRIACYEEISIGDSVHISWNSQIYDTDFHFIILEFNTLKKLFEFRIFFTKFRHFTLKSFDF